MRDCAGCLVEAELAARRDANERALLFGETTRSGSDSRGAMPDHPEARDWPGGVRPMLEPEARYLGLLYLEAQGWI